MLYRAISLTEAESMLEKVAPDAQEVNLPKEAVEAIMKALTASNALLPPTQRLFQQWTVGLLERYDED